MHANGNAEHRGEGDQVGTDVTVADRTVVGAPVIHHLVGIFKRRARDAVAARRKPGAGPCVVGALPKRVGHIFRQVDRPALGNLEHGTEPLDQVEADHRAGNLRLGYKARGEAAAAEIAVVGRAPLHVFHDRLLVGVGHIVPFLDGGSAALVERTAVGVHACRARVDQMDKSARILRVSLNFIACYALDRCLGPIGAHVGENLRTVGEQLHEQHAKPVERVVFGGEHVGLARAVPVKGGVEDRFGKIGVGVEVGPLTLTLKSCGDCVVSRCLFLAACGELGVSVHQVLNDHGKQNAEFKVALLLLIALADEIGVLVKADAAVFLCPCKRTRIFVGIVDFLGHAADDLHLVNRFHAHAEVVLDEVDVDLRARNAHAKRADLQIGPTAHRSGCDRGSAEAEQLFGHVDGNFGVVEVLHVATVDAEGGQALLRVCGKHGGKIDRTGALGAVKAPNALDRVRVHVHRFGAIAPAGRDRERDRNALTLEFFGPRRRFGNATDGGVGDHNLHGGTVGVAQIVLKKLGGTVSHAHRLLLQRLTHPKSTTSAVDRGTDADHGMGADQLIFSHGNSPFRLLNRGGERLFYFFCNRRTQQCLAVGVVVIAVGLVFGVTDRKGIGVENLHAKFVGNAEHLTVGILAPAARPFNAFVS